MGLESGGGVGWAQSSASDLDITVCEELSLEEPVISHQPDVLASIVNLLSLSPLGK